MTLLFYLLPLIDRHYRLVFLKIDSYQVQNILFSKFFIIQFTQSKKADLHFVIPHCSCLPEGNNDDVDELFGET